MSPVLAGVPSIAAFADARPEATAEDISREMTAAAAEHELRALAEAYIALMVDKVRRERAREAEYQACVAAHAESEAARQQEAGARRRAEAEETERGYQLLFADPLSYPGNQHQRRAFRDWAGEKFGEWYERGHAAAASEDDDQKLAFFESDWHPAGPMAYFRERRKRDMWELIDAESEHVRLKTTRELLSTIFALGDGTKTTWGAATVGQHRQRIELLASNAAGIVETATRHQAAIRMIEDSGVKCLDEIADQSPVLEAAR